MEQPIELIVKQLAESVTIQSKQANKFWLIMMAVAIIVIFPPIQKEGKSTSQNIQKKFITHTSSKGANSSSQTILKEEYPTFQKEEISTQQIELPFKIGIVDIRYFYPVLFSLFSILIFAFATAHIQSIRTHKLANYVLENMENEKYYGIYARDLFDMFRSTGISRTAPLAQFLLGKYQFFHSAENCPCWLKRLTSIYYLILKIISSGVYWILPLCAFYIAFYKSISSHIQLWIMILIYGIGIIAVSAMLIVARSDIIYILNVFRHLWSCKKRKSETL